MLFTINKQNLIHGDCVQIMKDMPESQFDVVVTSPPYNLDMPYATYEDKLPKNHYLTWMNDVFAQIKKVLIDDGSFFLNMGASTDPWLDLEVFNLLKDKLFLQNKIIWVKSITVDGKTTGHFKPVTSDRFLNRTWESIYHFSKTGKVKIDRLAVGVEYADKSNIKRWESKQDKRCDGNTWFIPYSTINHGSERGKHPATFPVGLPERCIKLHGIKENMKVLDPFVGIGTSLVACKNLDVYGTGIDIDLDYLNTAIKYLS